MTQPGSAMPHAISWRNLIFAGRDLLNPQRNGEPPTDEHVRRAISNGYYGLFHALASSNADVLIGTPHDPITAAAWTRVYRGMDHGPAKRELRQHRQEFSTGAQNFADLFGELQDRRNSADYDPGAVLTGHQATVWLAMAEFVCIDYLQVDRDERAYIASLTVTRGRRPG